MAEVVWTEPALGDLDAIADYIALENPDAARQLVQRVCRHVDQLASHPLRGPVAPDLPGLGYRQITEPPCRVFYRVDGEKVYVVHVLRAERLLRTALPGATGASEADATR